jgi:benzodiazapine receptor
MRLTSPTFLWTLISALCGSAAGFTSNPRVLGNVVPGAPIVSSTAKGFPSISCTRKSLRLSASPSLIQPVSLVLGHVLGGLLGVPVVAGAVNKPSGVDPQDSDLGGWYTRINLPPWTPPNRLFGPVWTLLYASMGWSLHRVLQHPKVTQSRRQIFLIMWSVHFLSNLSWAPVFFGMQRLRLALFINVWLITSLLLWMGLVGHFLPSAALLLVPYLGWLGFATILNLAIVQRNPTVKGYNEARFQADLLKMRRKAARYADGK